MPDSLGHTLGAMFIGSLVAMIIYGITTLQAYFYYVTCPQDGRYAMKALVASIWLLDTLHSILMSHAMYFYLITAFGNTFAHLEGTWSLYTSIGVNVIMAFIVQCYFVQRIITLSPQRFKWWLLLVIGILVLAHLIFGLETVIYFFFKKEFSRLKEVNHQSVLPFAITAILSDVLIAVALCILLASHRSEFEDTNNIINKLIVYAINRCILTSAVAIAEVVVFVILPTSFFSFAFDFVIGKLYANSLLASLNARPGTQRGSTMKQTSTSFHLASVDHVVTDLTRDNFANSDDGRLRKQAYV